MKHEPIDDKMRVWTVTMGPDGKLQAELDPRFLAEPADDVSDALVALAGAMEMDAMRTW